MRRGQVLIGVITLALALVASGVGASMADHRGHAPSAPTGLTVDDDAAPLAVTDDPAFGWLPQDPDQNEMQTAYQVVVFDGERIVADTERVTSGQQSYVHVPHLASKLEPNHAYAWKVRTWDRTRRSSPYASAAFVTGLRDRDWTARWIRRAGAEREPVEDFSRFRTEVQLAARPIARARVAASAGQQYELHVNGARLAHGPSLAYPDEQYYETTDVAHALKPGARNVFAFETFWGPPSQGRPASSPAFIAEITIDYADGSRQTVGTDSSWRVTRAPVTADHPRNDEGDWVERSDERADTPGWDAIGFSDTSWARATELGPAGTAPFVHLVAARTHIVETQARPMTVTKVAGAFVADFGQVIAATPVVSLQRGKPDARITLVGGYTLDASGHVSRTKSNQDTDMSWLFDARAGAQVLRPFGYLAFRYLEVDGATETLDAGSIQASARHANMPDESGSAFNTSDNTLNAVWKLARHSALYDSQEQFLDTPTREKGPFLGDGFDVSQATMVAFGERALTAQALRDFARSQARYWPDGRVNVVYPNGDGKRDIPDATESYIEWVWQSYLISGNRDQLAALYPTVRRITDYVNRAIDPHTGLVTKLPGGGDDYLYGAVDWPQWMRYGYDMSTTARTTVNVLAVDDFARAAAMAEALDRPPAEFTLQHSRAMALTHAIQSKLARPDGVFVDGLRADGTQSPHAGQQANAWALAFGLVTAAQVKAVADHIVSLKNSMGVVYFRVLLDALHSAGRDDALVAALTDPNRPGYAQILKRGATFTWESWIAPEVGDSESHGWGATVLAVLLEDLAGVRVLAPGAAHIAITVPSTDIAKAQATVATQRGPVGVTWTRDRSGHATAAVDIPVNVTATVRIGDQTGELGSGHWTLDSAKPIPEARSSSASNGGSGLPIAAGIAGLAILAVAVTVLLVRRRRLHGV